MDEQKITHAISQVKHPEINSSLVDLGMVKDIQVENDKVSLKLLLPMMGIPQVVKDFMINSLKEAVSQQGAVLDVTLAEMTPEERQRFFAMEQENWGG